MRINYVIGLLGPPTGNHTMHAWARSYVGAAEGEALRVWIGAWPGLRVGWLGSKKCWLAGLLAGSDGAGQVLCGWV